jgi:hypothetical protein
MVFYTRDPWGLKDPKGLYLHGIDCIMEVAALEVKDASGS